jgi:hypothetical protein
MTAHHHHYLSQFHLKGFTNGGSKKSKLTVIDLPQKKHFETIPQNVGGLRDFNRLETPGVDQNALEGDLAEFEGSADKALRQIEEGTRLEGEVRNLILNLVALFAMRSPERREHWRQFHAEIMESMMGLNLASKERWESQMGKMQEAGKGIDKGVTYEEVKRFYESKAYKIEVAREHHIRTEFVAVEAVLPDLHRRKWLIVRSSKMTGPFITSDNPVNLAWKEPEKIPLFYRNSPGFALKSTQLCFPLSRRAALIGEFDGPEGETIGTRELVSALNSKTFWYTYKQLYAPKLNFLFMDKGGEIINGSNLLKYIADRQRSDPI